MKRKRPRSTKAVKPAARLLRRATRPKPALSRRKTGPRKAYPGRRVPARRKTGAAAKVKAIRRRPTRRTTAKALLPLPESKQAAPLEAGGIEPEAQAIPKAPPVGSVRQAPPSAPPSEAARAEQIAETPAPAGTGVPMLPILLEGDETPPPSLTGPGQKYALEPTPSAPLVAGAQASLPEAYGTGKLLLAARDPHWLYAQWDLTPQQQRQYNALSAEGHLVVRLFPGALGGRPVREIPVHPESRHWFIHVDRAETRYVARLGYYTPSRRWVTVATSAPAVTPPDTASTDQTLRFATIPAHVRLTQLAALTQQAAPPAGPPPLEPARERALAELAKARVTPEEVPGSPGIAEAAPRQGKQPGAAVEPGPFALSSLEAASISSPYGVAQQRPAGFWFSVNAELVLYGATEPDATVAIGGQPVHLRPDGTFSCRLALPDGEHAVTVSALSAQGELRQAELRFVRRTDYRDEPNPAPPDQSPPPPATETP